MKAGTKGALSFKYLHIRTFSQNAIIYEIFTHHHRLFSVVDALLCTKTYTEKLRQNEAGKGTVIINHSPEIDEVVNAKTSEHNTKKATPVKKDDTHTGSAATKVTPKNTGHNEAEHAHNTAGKDTKATTHVNDRAESQHRTTGRKDTPKRENEGSHSYVSRARHKARGFRICIFTGGNSRADKQKAIQMGRKCREKFAELAVYPSFEAPRWVTHVGDFKTRQEAQKYVTKIRRAHFTYEVRIVASEVNVPY